MLKKAFGQAMVGSIALSSFLAHASPDIFFDKAEGFYASVQGGAAVGNMAQETLNEQGFLSKLLSKDSTTHKSTMSVGPAGNVVAGHNFGNGFSIEATYGISLDKITVTATSEKTTAPAAGRFPFYNTSTQQLKAEPTSIGGSATSHTLSLLAQNAIAVNPDYEVFLGFGAAFMRGIWTLDLTKLPVELPKQPESASLIRSALGIAGKLGVSYKLDDDMNFRVSANGAIPMQAIFGTDQSNMPNSMFSITAGVEYAIS